jgi:hypothetical protein
MLSALAVVMVIGMPVPAPPPPAALGFDVSGPLAEEPVTATATAMALTMAAARTPVMPTMTQAADRVTVPTDMSVAERHRLLAAPGKDREKLAMLRSVAADAHQDWAQLFATAVREPRCHESVTSGDTPAEYALQRLLRACGEDPRARAALEVLTFGDDPVPAVHRERAARAYAASATLGEVAFVRARAECVTDSVLREALAAGLAATAQR